VAVNAVEICSSIQALMGSQVVESHFASQVVESHFASQVVESHFAASTEGIVAAPP
jgi:hypothetical protein